MAKLGKAYVELSADMTQLKQDLDKAKQKIKGLSDKIEHDFEQKATASFTRVSKAALGLGAVFLGGLGISVVTSSIREFVQASGKQEQAVAGLTQAMRSMGRYSASLESTLLGTAKALQRTTTFGDEATISGQKFLLTYKDIGTNVLPRATKTMLDLAALMGGDTVQAANMLGKASMGMTGELRRVGITVDQATFKSEGFLGVLREIESHVGGQAEALAQTGYGGIQQLGNIVGDVKEKLGDLVLIEFGDVAREWAKGVAELNDELERIVERRRKEAAAGDLVDIWFGGPESGGGPGALAGGANMIDKFVAAIQRGKRMQRLSSEYGGGGLEKEYWRNWYLTVSSGAQDYDEALIGAAEAFNELFGSDAVSKVSKVDTELKKLNEKLRKDELKIATDYDESILEARETYLKYELDAIKKMLADEQQLRQQIYQQEIRRAEQYDDSIIQANEDMSEYELDLIRKTIAEKESLQDDSLREQDRAYAHFLSKLHDTTADTFYDMFSGQLNTFEDFLSRMKDLFMRWLAEIAAQALVQPILFPIVSGAFGGMGMPGVAGAAMGTGGIGGGGGLGGLLGGGIGAAGGWASTPAWGGSVFAPGSEAAGLEAYAAAGSGAPTWGALLGGGALIAGGAYMGYQGWQNRANMSTGEGAMTGVGAGAMMGAGVGTIFPGIGTVAGAIVGGLVGGIAGAMGAGTGGSQFGLGGKFNVSSTGTGLSVTEIASYAQDVSNDVATQSTYAMRELLGATLAPFVTMAKKLPDNIEQAFLDEFTQIQVAFQVDSKDPEELQRQFGQGLGHMSKDVVQRMGPQLEPYIRGQSGFFFEALTSMIDKVGWDELAGNFAEVSEALLQIESIIDP